MGTNKTERPKRLTEKLRRIRLRLGLSQIGMAEALEKFDVKMYPGYVGSYETNARVPSLLVILAYSKIAKVPVEQIIDDERGLPRGF
jgi:transcriptional regulator with XRE-family HTH domain